MGHNKKAAYVYDDKINKVTASQHTWMEYIPGNIPLGQLSIPGTHDTMTYDVINTHDSAQCQSFNLEKQLNLGIRYIDIRLRCVDEYRLLACHGIVDTNLYLTDIFTDITDFLDNYPSETIVTKIKQEQSNAQQECGSRTFGAIFGDHYNNWESYMYDAYTGGKMPLLGDVRGKIIIVRDIGLDGSSTYGISKNKINKASYVNYEIENNFALCDHWKDRKKSLLDYVSLYSDNEYYFHKVPLNGAVGSFPYFVASGHSSPQTTAPRLLTGCTQTICDTVGCDNGFCNTDNRKECIHKEGDNIAFEGHNVGMYNLLSNDDSIIFTGIMIFDFPGQGLIDQVIKRNIRHYNPLRACNSITGIRSAYNHFWLTRKDNNKNPSLYKAADLTQNDIYGFNCISTQNQWVRFESDQSDNKNMKYKSDVQDGIVFYSGTGSSSQWKFDTDSNKCETFRYLIYCPLYNNGDQNKCMALNGDNDIKMISCNSCNSLSCKWYLYDADWSWFPSNTDGPLPPPPGQP